MALPTAYVAGGVDPRSRFWHLVNDVTATPSIVEAAADQHVANSLSTARLLIRLPTDQDGATAATVKVATASSGSPVAIELTLARTLVPSESADVLQIAPSGATVPCTRLRQVIDWIGSLQVGTTGKGWEVGFRFEDRDVEWFDPSSTVWLASLRKLRRIAEHVPSVNLALTPGENTIVAYGDREDAAELPFYRMGFAAKEALPGLEVAGGVAGGEALREGNRQQGGVTVTSAAGSRISRMCASGFYAV